MNPLVSTLILWNQRGKHFQEKAYIKSELSTHRLLQNYVLRKTLSMFIPRRMNRGPPAPPFFCPPNVHNKRFVLSKFDFLMSHFSEALSLHCHLRRFCQWWFLSRFQFQQIPQISKWTIHIYSQWCRYLFSLHPKLHHLQLFLFVTTLKRCCLIRRKNLQGISWNWKMNRVCKTDCYIYFCCFPRFTLMLTEIIAILPGNMFDKVSISDSAKNRFSFCNVASILMLAEVEMHTGRCVSEKRPEGFFVDEHELKLFWKSLYLFAPCYFYFFCHFFFMFFLNFRKIQVLFSFVALSFISLYQLVYYVFRYSDYEKT